MAKLMDEVCHDGSIETSLLSFQGESSDDSSTTRGNVPNWIFKPMEYGSRYSQSSWMRNNSTPLLRKVNGNDRYSHPRRRSKWAYKLYFILLSLPRFLSYHSGGSLIPRIPAKTIASQGRDDFGKFPG